MPHLLLLPSGNSFTHLLECLSIGNSLEAFGHEIHYGISRHYAVWAKKHCLSYTVVAELWEKGPTDHPNISWFIDRDHVQECVRQEIKLIERQQPDYILAAFRYTTGISARTTGIRLFTLNILPMLPKSKSNFGYLPGDDSKASRQQKKQLKFFNTFCCSTLNTVAEKFGQPPRQHMSDYLEGDWCLIPDSTWYHQINMASLPPNYLQVNGLQLERTPPELQTDLAWLLKKKSARQDSATTGMPAGAFRKSHKSKTIFLALGSICRSREVLSRLVSILVGGPWKLYVSISSKDSGFLRQLQHEYPQISFATFFDLQHLPGPGQLLHEIIGGTTLSVCVNSDLAGWKP